MSNNLRAIETRYKSYRFRSRLEARWAVLFDHMGVEWEYEPEGYHLGGDLGCYLPDFFLYGNGHYGPYIEIKGQAPTQTEFAKLTALCGEKCAYGAIIWGQPGQEKWVSIHKDGFRDHEEENRDLHSIFLGAPYDARPVLYARAVVAARSARFEHGESP
jgi:hypothetical protein